MLRRFCVVYKKAVGGGWGLGAGGWVRGLPWLTSVAALVCECEHVVCECAPLQAKIVLFCPSHYI